MWLFSYAVMYSSSSRFPCTVLFSKSDPFKASEMPRQQWEVADQYGWKIEKKMHCVK